MTRTPAPRVPRTPPQPRYNPERDGNPFAWIVARAEQYRKDTPK